MSRIQKAYASRFRERLRERGEEEPEQQALRLEEQAQKLSLEKGISLIEALAVTDRNILADMGVRRNAQRESRILVVATR